MTRLRRFVYCNEKYPWAVLHKNDVGRGVVNAVKAGIAATTADVVIVTMADLSDDLTVVPRMVELIRQQELWTFRMCLALYARGPADRRALAQSD